jgi:hypothetical protein
VAFIRIGFFEDFKGADTLLLDVDRDGLHSLIAWLRMDMSSGRNTTIGDCPATVIQSGLHVEVLGAADDAGLVRTSGGHFAWRRSEDGWANIIDKLAAMETGGCHQYLDGPQDGVQVMASIGEYGDAWWRRYDC